MKLSEVMLLKEILFNSEAWHGLTEKQVSSLEASTLQNSQRTCKTNIKIILSRNRCHTNQERNFPNKVNYLKHITSREDTELVKKSVFGTKRSYYSWWHC